MENKYEELFTGFSILNEDIITIYVIPAKAAIQMICGEIDSGSETGMTYRG